MTARQYIGARYIPIFADPVEWDNERAYEHLMMVQHQGETYLSQQAVPIGIDLPDTSQGEESNDYWVHMSNWNAQVETYRQEVLQYNGRISTVENDLPTTDFDSTNTVKKAIDDAVALLPGTDFDSTNTVKAAIDDAVALLPGTNFDSTNTVKKAIDAAVALLPGTDFDSTNTVKAAIDGLQTKINNVEDVIPKSSFTDSNTVKNYIDKMKSRFSKNGSRMLIIGDSFCCYSRNGLYTATWPNAVASSLGLTLTNLSTPGSGWVVQGEGNSTFATQCDEAIALSNKNDYALILIYGGANELANATSMRSVAETNIAALKTNFPNAEIVILGCTTSKDGWNDGVQYLTNYLTQLELVARETHVRYIKDAWTWMVFPTAYTTDNVHPSTAQDAIIGHNVIQALLGGDYFWSTLTNTFNFTNSTFESSGYRNGYIGNNKVFFPAFSVNLSDTDAQTIISEGRSWMLASAQWTSSFITDRKIVGYTILTDTTNGHNQLYFIYSSAYGAFSMMANSAPDAYVSGHSYRLYVSEINLPISSCPIY